MNVADWLHATAREAPDAPALMIGGRVVEDYRGFARAAAAIGANLAARHGVRAGDRVGLFMANAVDYLEILYGIWWIGAVAVPINNKLHAKEAAWILSDSGTRLVIASDAIGAAFGDPATGVPRSTGVLLTGDPGFATLAEGAGPPQPLERERSDLAWLFYTSGTTGRPKGVMLSHGNLASMAMCHAIDVEPAERTDAVVYASPMSHGAGMFNFIHVRVGARHVVPESGGFDAAEILDLAARLRNVTLFAAPTMVKRIVEAARETGRDGDGIKAIVYGGGPMYLADLEEGLRVLGPRFAQVYGQGESPMTITACSRGRLAGLARRGETERMASAGVAQSMVRVRVAGIDGGTLPPGETGEILVRGDTLMLGYWDNPEATIKTIRDGWLWTGDMGHMDEAGYVTLTDRSKDMIVSGGINIYPREVEEVLLRHPDVREVSVVGRPHPQWGEEVVAFVALREGAAFSAAALDAVCLDNIARFKRPKAYIQVDELPKNNYGKVLKTALRERLKAPA